eukprot:1000339_1
MGTGISTMLEKDVLKDALSKFAPSERDLLSSLFRSLAKRSPGETMDKVTFTNMFNLPGIMGDRLFTVFDKKGDGKIHWEEFVIGLASYSRGDIDEKIAMLFRMFDLNGENSVNKEELTTMLYSLMTPTSSLIMNALKS